MFCCRCRHQITSTARNLGIDLTSATIINPANFEGLERYVQLYYEKRKHKGVTFELARDALMDVNAFGTVSLSQTKVYC